MEQQGVSVRKNIALKLRDQGPPHISKIQPPSDTKKEGGEGGGDVDSSEAPLPGDTTDYSDHNWDHTLHFCGRGIKDPLLHLCEVCSLPVLIYGRMKRCRHAFCRDCAKKNGGVCQRCQEGDQSFEEASMGSVYVCTHGGGRYDNSGCGRSYLSQRDLDAHILYRHNKDKAGLSQTGGGGLVASYLTAPPPPSSLAGFSLPPFFQPGMMAHRLPPGFPPHAPIVLRPGGSLPPNANPLGGVGGPGVLRSPLGLGPLGPPLMPPPPPPPPPSRYGVPPPM